MARILIIDDDPSIRSIFKRFLESCDYTVDTAADGREGLRVLAEKESDLVITDIMMPDMDGLEVIRTVKEQYPGLPMIAISGGMRVAPFNFLHLAEKFGACRIFFKPVEMDKLHEAVQELLGN